MQWKWPKWIKLHTFTHSHAKALIHLILLCFCFSADLAIISCAHRMIIDDVHAARIPSNYDNIISTTIYCSSATVGKFSLCLSKKVRKFNLLHSIDWHLHFAIILWCNTLAFKDNILVFPKSLILLMCISFVFDYFVAYNFGLIHYLT